MAFKEKIVGTTGAVSSTASVLGGYQVCHNVCLGIIALLSIIGITVSGMPLMFLTKVAVPFWIAGVAIVVLMFLLSQTKYLKFSQNLMVANAGLLIAGIPFQSVSRFQELFWILGGSLIVVSVVLFIQERITHKNKEQKKFFENKNFTNALFIVGCLALVGIVLFNFLTFSRLKNVRQTSQQSPMISHSLSMMSFTGFDEQEARAFMDKNDDSLCDACGMPIDQCIASGMMQCSMDKNAKIGLLGSQHIHADWKVYIDGKLFDWTSFEDRHERQMSGDKTVKDTSAFIHIHPAVAPEKAGDVLHMHATGVPLSMFFESLGMKFDKNCLTLQSSKYCSDDKNLLKFYVNGQPNNEYGNYVFKNLDKILISYGLKNEDVNNQLVTITSFAEGGH